MLKELPFAPITWLLIGSDGNFTGTSVYSSISSQLSLAQVL